MDDVEVWKRLMVPSHRRKPNFHNIPRAKQTPNVILFQKGKIGKRGQHRAGNQQNARGI